MNKNHPKSAFTLVELLVVIGIIAVLISILLPTLSRAREVAQRTQCQSNMHQWGIGLQMYVNESRGQMPLRVPDGTAAEWFGPSLANPIPGYPAGVDDASIFFNAIPSRATGRSYYQLLVDDKAGRNKMPSVGSNNIFTCPSVQAAAPGTGDMLFPTDSNFYALYGTDSTGTLMSATSPDLFKSNVSYCYNNSLMNPPAPTAANPSPALILGEDVRACARRRRSSSSAKKSPTPANISISRSNPGPPTTDFSVPRSTRRKAIRARSA